MAMTDWRRASPNCKMAKKSCLIWLFVGALICLNGLTTSVAASRVQPATVVDSDPVTQDLTQIGGFGGTISDMVVQDGLLYVTLGARLVIFDVQDPTQPMQVAQAPVMPAKALEMDIAAGYAYVADGLGGLRIFDIHTSITPTPVSAYQPDGFVEDVKVVGNHAYVAKTPISTTEGVVGAGLDIVDVSDPAAPFLAGQFPVDADDLHSLVQVNIDVVGDVVYFGEVRNYSSDGLRIVDVSNPAAPAQMSAFTFPVERGGVYDIVVRNGIAFVTSTYRLYALDVSNPPGPTLIGEYGYPAYGGQVALVGDYAYVTDFNRASGLHVVDVSPPTDLKPVTALETGAGVSSVTAAGNTVYWAGTTYQSRIALLDVTTPQQPLLVGAIDTPSLQDSSRLALNGAYLYTSEYFDLPVAGHISDVRNPAAATILNDGGIHFADALFAGAYGYALTEESHNTDAEIALQIFSMTEPQNPALSTSLTLPATWPQTLKMVLARSHVYIMADDSIFVVNVNDPTQPSLTSTYSSAHGKFFDIVQQANHLYLKSAEHLQILDISTPGAPHEISATELVDVDYNAALAVVENYVYLGSKQRIAIIDVVIPSAPTAAGFVTTGGNVGAIESSNGHLFVIHNQYDHYAGPAVAGGLQIFEVIHNPTAPTEVAAHQQTLFPRDIVVDGRMIYTVNGPEGVVAFRFTPPAHINVSDRAFTLFEAPFDQTRYTFPAGIFGRAVTVTHTTETPATLPPLGALEAIDHNFVVTAVDEENGQPATVLSNQTYSIAVNYRDIEVANVVESSLALYRWDEQAWQVEPSSLLDAANNRVTATPNQLGRFAVLGETHRQYLPFVSVVSQAE